MKILGNPPYAKGRLHKRIFNEACKHGEVHFLQPVGAWRTHVGNVEKLYPLHTSVKMFDIALMALGIHTNLDKNVLVWDTSKIPTVKDYEQGTVVLRLRDASTCSARKACNTVPLQQEMLTKDIPLKVSLYQEGGVNAKSGVAMKQDLALLNVGPTASGEQGTIPLKMNTFNMIADCKKASNAVQISQDLAPLRLHDFREGRGVGMGNGVVLQQEKLLAPLNVGPSKSHSEIFNTCDFDIEKLKKTCIFFNTKKERTNFIKNISKIIALQILFYSGLFPKSNDRIMPPVDREYSKDELLEYFGFPKDVFLIFDDIEKEEPNSHYTSYERWRDWRKEKYGLDWEEE